MKKMICEMCGSQDLIKQDGLFVCQMCGCKYSVEEARKMMIEGVVDVSGSKIKLDMSDKLKNLYILARRAKDDNNTEDAAKYYSEIRMEDPNSWEAAFYAVYYTAASCNFGEMVSALKSVTGCLDSISKLILDYLPKEEQTVAYTEMVYRTAAIGTAFFNTSKDAYLNSDSSNKSNLFTERAIASITTIYGAGLMADTKFNDIQLAKKIYESCIETCNSFELSKKYAQIPQDALDQIKLRLQAMRKKKDNEYWATHIEEKNNLENERNQLVTEKGLLNEKIMSLVNQKDSMPIKAEYANLQQMIKDYTKQLNYLGIFKGKEKKELQEKIDKCKKSAYEAKNKMTIQSLEYEKMIANMRDRIVHIDKRIEEINEELN